MSERGWCYLVFEKALRMMWLCSEKCWFGHLIIIVSHVWSSLSSVEVGQNRYRAAGFIVCLKWGTDSPDPSFVIKHHNLYSPALHLINPSLEIHDLHWHVKQLFPWWEKTNWVLGACCFVSLVLRITCGSHNGLNMLPPTTRGPRGDLFADKS